MGTCILSELKQRTNGNAGTSTCDCEAELQRRLICNAREVSVGTEINDEFGLLVGAAALGVWQTGSY